MSEAPDTITVSGQATIDVPASHADITVSVAGSSAFGADQAIAKAREVAALAADLERAGIGPDRVEVLGITTTATTGRLSRHSAATYQLRVRTETVDQVPTVLDVVAAQKNAGIDGIDWRYPDAAGGNEALQQAVSAGRERAEVVAAALGVTLLAVHRLTEHSYDEDHRPMPRMAAMAESAAPGMDLEVVHRKRIRATAEITYRIG